MRHNGDKGADVQQGPVPRFLFRLRPCVNLFHCLLLAHTPLVLKTTKRDTNTIGKIIIRRFKIDVKREAPNVFLRFVPSPQLLFRHAEYMHVSGNSGIIIEGGTQPVYVVKFEYHRECLASRVWPYMHQLRIMSWVNCWVCPAPVFCYLTFRYIG